MSRRLYATPTPIMGSSRGTAEGIENGFSSAVQLGPVGMDTQHQWSPLREESSSKTDSFQKDIVSDTVSKQPSSKLALSEVMFVRH